MLKPLNPIKTFLALFFLLLIASCGGGGNSVSGIDGSGAPATASTPTTSTGTISGFGSVIVNGIHFNSDKASIIINGQTGTEDDLRVGYQVSITGEIKTDGSAVANSIEFFPALSGKISSINNLSKSFTVGELTVITNTKTLLDAAITPNFFETLKVGDNVNVSGSRDGKGNLIATRISYGNTQALVTGSISKVDTTQTTFTVDGTTVNYATAKFTNITTNQLANGLLIRAKGTFLNNVLYATDVSAITQRFDKSAKSASIEGRVTRFTSITDFAIDDMPCTTSVNTHFNGGKPSDLNLGALVSAKGTVTSEGKLLVETIGVNADSDSEIAGQVTQVIVESSASSVAFGSLVINNLTIQTTALTTYEDRGSSKFKRFNFNNILKGDFLKISGFVKNSVFYATKIEREELEDNKDTELKFKGIFTAIDSHTFSLLNRVVATNNSTEFKNAKGKNVSEAEFYATAVGQLVEVKGILRSGKFTATEVEIALSSSDD